jgi:hypothetical protein
VGFLPLSFLPQARQRVGHRASCCISVTHDELGARPNGHKQPMRFRTPLPYIVHRRVHRSCAQFFLMVTWICSHVLHSSLSTTSVEAPTGVCLPTGSEGLAPALACNLQLIYLPSEQG